MALLLETRPLAGTIRSLAELLRALDRGSCPAGYTDALMRLSLDPAEWTAYCRWNTRHYTRQCIHRSREHELLLICYNEGQRTSIHDYDSQLAWIKPLLGTVLEERFEAVADGTLKRNGEKVLGIGSLSCMAAKNCVHRHSNAGPGRTATLNLYARPIRRWRVYDERTGLASLSGTGGTCSE
jgi:hypothetical protein